MKGAHYYEKYSHHKYFGPILGAILENGLCQKNKNGATWKFFNNFLYKLQIERGSFKKSQPVFVAPHVVNHSGHMGGSAIFQEHSIYTIFHTKSKLKGIYFMKQI